MNVRMMLKQHKAAIHHAREQARAERERAVLQAKIDREYEQQRRAAERDIALLSLPDHLMTAVRWLLYRLFLFALFGAGTYALGKIFHISRYDETGWIIAAAVTGTLVIKLHHKIRR